MKECFYCGCPEGVRPIHIHHVFKRSTHPELKDDKENLCPLCWQCHFKTESSNAFLKEIQQLWNIKKFKKS